MIDRVRLTKELQAGLVARARAEGFLVYDAGSVGGETNGVAWDVRLYTDQACARCRHTACPCCPVPFCDAHECIFADDTPCLDDGCVFAAPPRFFTADGAIWAEPMGEAS